MRIITGSAKGTNLETLEGLETRPTAVRVKEALFSMIQFDIEGRRALDLFAGSGQLGLEALSRGAASATFIDVSREAADIILRNAAKTKLKDRASVAVYDYESYLKNGKFAEGYDLIFLDPPYKSNYLHRALELIASSSVLREGGTVVCETDTDESERKRKRCDPVDVEEAVLRDVFGGDAELMAKYEVIKSSRYGRSRITLLSM
ncbi:MAG: 16S rRNA (guanine(966)-N(2))-methyltransferase RsmD [Clostridia bacterium]|nr:16S rRNA (guanine(966)-N(2))-methyltransferase RsmD [Clostridia bacterium]